MRAPDVKALAALLLVFLLAAPVTALAHAKLTQSSPANGATVPAGLTQIQIQFSKPLRLTVVKIAHADASGDVVEAGALPKDPTKSATFAVPPLQSGPYEVSWTAVATDGHVMTGHFQFSVGEDASPKPTP